MGKERVDSPTAAPRPAGPVGYKPGGKAKASVLIMPYTPAKRAWDVACTWVYLFVLVSQWPQLRQDSWAPIGVIAGIFLADFFSGVLHWGFDTWGTQSTPLAGNFIRSFREHHVDPVAMCDHDFFEANGDSFAVMIGLITACNVIPALTGINLLWYQSVPSVWVAFTIFGGLTNELHKWSHSRSKNPVVTFMQRNGLILPPHHHNQHHKNQHDDAYCITTGWCNPFLDKINFWRMLEAAITYVSGVPPRKDDLKLLTMVR